MTLLSEKFSEQYSRVQQQFKEWTQLEQLCAIVELTRTFQLSYQHFLAQLFQSNIQCENNDMFNHTVDDANASDIVACLLSNSLDKVLFTVQLYLPLISTTKINEKLLDAYRNVLIYLDANIQNSSKFSYKEDQIISFCQQILFCIQKNFYLKTLSLHIPQLIQLVQTNKFQSNEPQSYPQPIQRYASIRSQGQPLMTYSSESITPNAALCQQLTRDGTSDSGVDLTETSRTNSIQNILSQNSQRMNLSSSASKHSFVAKTASSPIPEYVTVSPATRTPLKGALSAPPSTVYSDYRHKNGNYLQKHIPLLTKSDEEEVENSKSTEECHSETTKNNESTKTLTQFRSFRYPSTKNNQNQDNVSQYLAIDVNSNSIQNTFIQPNTGMKDVPKWLRYLRLHKYDIVFSKMTYDQMMNLTVDELKELQITEGARSKILLNIKKLKERYSLLQQWLVDMDDPQVDLKIYIDKLNELMITPMRSKQLELENNSNEDLPSLIMQVLEKIYRKLTTNTSPEISNSLLGLFDRCYKHEAFTGDQRDILLRWRGRLANLLQSLGRIEYKTIQSTLTHSSQPRRSGKPAVRNMKSSTGGPHYSNHSSSAVQLNKYKSDPPKTNYNDSNLIRRPNKSPNSIYSNTEESNDSFVQSPFSCLTSTPQNSNSAYFINHERQALTRKPSINPYDELNTNTKTKLCKTYSDPNRMRFYNSTQVNNMQLSPSTQQQNLLRIASSPYSQQTRNFMSRSPPTSTTMDMPSSPIKKCFSDNERIDYYETNNNSTPLSNISNTTDIETSDDQRHHNTEIESLCRQITESAMSDNVNDSSIDRKEDSLNIKQSSNHSSDIEW